LNEQETIQVANAENVEMYAIPCERADLRSDVAVPPWIERFIDASPKKVARLLKDDWSKVASAAVMRLGDTILARCEPSALAREGERWYVKLRYEQYDAEHALFLDSPPTPRSLEDALARHRCAEPEVLREFYANFYGMRDDMGYPSSRFERPEEWTPFESLGWDEEIEEFDRDRQWAPAPIIYMHSTGDSVLLKPNGEVAWALLAETPKTGPFVPIASSFSRFVDEVVDSAKDNHLIFDYYQWLERRGC